MNPESTNSPQTALVVSYSTIDSDPRVRREAEWLAAKGFDVDTLGLGTKTSEGVRQHYPLGKPTKWTVTYPGAALSGRVLPFVTSFRRQLLDRVPRAVIQEVQSGEYDLIVLNEMEFLPWLSDKKSLGKAATDTHIHVDLHEKHNPSRRRKTVGARIAARYYRRTYRNISHPLIASRTVVNKPIGQMYVDELGITAPTPVRNIPPREDLSPVDRHDGKIKLLFHGLAAHERGFDKILGAMAALPERFDMTFMLVPTPHVMAWLDEEIPKNPAKDRIHIVPPSPMREIAKNINQYDMEIIYYPHLNSNLEYALPNKFFESIQGRLGLVVRDDRTMGPLVREWGNGVVVPGHSTENLVNALKDITPSDVQRMKKASDKVADEVNAETEGLAFLEALGL